MHKRHLAILAASAATGLALTLSAGAAEVVLSGSIKNAAGEKMGGVTVSAKAAGSTITTTVFTDEAGDYYFPPMEAGKYRVWAQALAFDTAKSEVDLAAARRADFTLAPITDTELLIKQMPGDLLLAGLPEETADDARMKRIFRNNCTSCHTPSYTLQHRFDERGWSAIIAAMKNINVYGAYRPGQPVLNKVIDFHHKELAGYLAKVRGPGGQFKITTRARPTGEAARVVFKEYEVPLNQDQVLAAKTPPNNGSDWTMGTTSRVGSIPHDAAADNDGNLWYASVSPNKNLSVGRVDAKTGEVKPFKVNAPSGLAALSHGLIRDADGIIWFNVHVSKGALAKIDPKTEKMSVYLPPSGMSQIEGPVTLDYDGAGGIWAGTIDGTLRFDPKEEKFTEFKSVTPTTAKGGQGATYGIAGDQDGNVWWTQMAFDTIGKGDLKTGKSIEIKLPPIKNEMDRATPADMKFYDSYAPRDIGTPYPWSQGPRRIGIDRPANVLWIANSWGGNLTRIDTKTNDVTFVQFPNPSAHQPYATIADKKHNVWAPMWTTDQIAKYDPTAQKWTMFDLPTRGTEVRIASLRDLPNDKLEVTVAYPRSSKVAVMTSRSEAEIAALKSQAAR
jgi:streptogramin lyase